MISPARRVSLGLLERIESRRLHSDDALNSPAMERLEVRDRHLVTEIVYGTLRWRGPLDHLLAARSARPWAEVEPATRTLLRMSLYQMWKMGRVPDHAVCNDAVELARRESGRGSDRYVNGILRGLGRARPWERPGFLDGAPGWVRLSLPRWLYQRWVRRWGAAQAEEFALSLNRPPRAAFRLTGAEGEGETPPGESSPLVPGARLSLDEAPPGGRAHLQDEASQLMPHLFGPAGQGGRVWDACAAPGGKTAVLGGIFGRVVSSDISPGRVRRMLELLRAQGVRPGGVIVADAGGPAPFGVEFDAALADVPCSGLGTLRRNPEIKWNFRPEEFAALGRVQAAILRGVSQSVAVGGRLLYSTCSTEPEENERVVEYFLGAHPGFRIEEPRYPEGVAAWVGTDGCVRTFPSARRWDGFFAALLRRWN